MATLNDLATGQSALIKTIDDIDVAIQALRMGISTGETVKCVAKVPAGPTVIQHGGTELAIGHALCAKIEVEIK